MKTACYLMLLAVFAGSGCWALPSFLEPADPPKPPALEPPKPRGPVLPDRVTAANAHQMADALDDELDRAERETEHP
jgi:hypothetical protein